MTRLFLNLFIVLAAERALAQSPTEYVAKFLCGRASGDVVKTFGIAPGVYYSKIDISNVDGDVQSKGTARILVNVPQQKQERKQHVLEWTAAASSLSQFGCGDIYKQLNIESGKFIDGSLHIVGGPVRFDVSVVYTLFDGNYPVSINVQHLTPR